MASTAFAVWYTKKRFSIEKTKNQKPLRGFFSTLFLELKWRRKKSPKEFFLCIYGVKKHLALLFLSFFNI